MGYYTEYLTNRRTPEQLNSDRKEQLARISLARGGRPVLVMASALAKGGPGVNVTINFNDRVPFFDQLNDIEGPDLDLILETPGGDATIVEDMVKVIRHRFTNLAVIVPGYAKSAGTIMAMAADEILLEPSSALGPIDAQIFDGQKRYSAHAYLEGLRKIKQEVLDDGYLNKAYLPILQHITPAEIEEVHNAYSFSRELVTLWLSTYKFRTWETHSSDGRPVTEEDKTRRAEEIATDLCNHEKWRSHGRSIMLSDLREQLRLRVTDYSEDDDLCEAIRRYYTLLKMTFDISTVYKVFETPTSQVYLLSKTAREAEPREAQKTPQKNTKMLVDLQCPKCHTETKLQANLVSGVPLEDGALPFPQDDRFVCPNCGHILDLSALRSSLETKVQGHILKEA